MAASHFRQTLVAGLIVVTNLPLAAEVLLPQHSSVPGLPWPATDGLGRALPVAGEAPAVRNGRFVGIFYFIWLGCHGTSGPFDLTKILRNPKPSFGPPGAFHHWGKPELGYYVSRDPWVLRRHATQLTDAGIDFVALDVTNAYTYEREVKALCDTWLAMRAEGNPTPQIVFLTNTRHETVVQRLYDLYYREPGPYAPLWFLWQGKPLAMASNEGLSEPVRTTLTFRRSWAWTNAKGWFGDGMERWPWLDHTPQKGGWREPGKAEQLPVAVAQHPISNIGRSHRGGVQPGPGEESSANGFYFQEQWDHALKVDPEVVFVTGWNEWVAQRAIKEAGKPPDRLTGKPLNPGDTFFVDAYSAEFSRDIEPMDGGFGDAYYYQLIANVRRFKGIPPMPEGTDVQAFTDTVGDTAHRKHEGWASETLTEQTGRNDIVSVVFKSAEGQSQVTVETRDPITAPLDDRWMLLYLDIDGSSETGWHGYDYVLNRTRPESGKTSIEKLAADGSRILVGTTPFSFVVGERSCTFTIPKFAEFNGRRFFDIHATDNAPASTRFFLEGDHAPNRRFNYRLTVPKHFRFDQQPTPER
jgi:hypothetical protein